MYSISETWTYSALGELVHSLLSTNTTSLEHIQKTSLVRAHAHNLRHKVANHLGALGESL